MLDWFHVVLPLANTMPPVPFSPQSGKQPDTQKTALPPIIGQEFARGSHADSSARNADCCQPGCEGSSCRKLRGMLQDLISEITRDPLAPTIPLIGYQPPKPVSACLMP